MIFKEIIIEFIKTNKKLIFSYISISSMIQIIKVIILSSRYSELMKNINMFNEKIIDVMFIWIALCILYIGKMKLESEIYSDLLFFTRNILYRKYIIHNYYDFNDNDSISDVNKIIDASKLLRDIFYLIFQTFIPTIILIIGMNIYFSLKFSKIGVINIVSNIFNYIIIDYFGNDIYNTVDIKQNKLTEIINKLYENLNNLMDIFLNGKYDDAIAQYSTLEKEYMIIHKNEFGNINKFVSLLKINNYIFSFISIYTFYKYYSKEDMINGLLIFTFYISNFQELSEDIPRLFSLLGTLKSLENKLKDKLSQNNIVCKSIKPIIQGNINFQNINFNYSTSDNIITNFNLKINEGDRVAIVSESGSGKSTLMKLLLKFYKPTGGIIMLDGKNINDIDTDYLRKNINYINQKTILFNDTIINNMKYGSEKSDNEIINLLKKYDLLTLFSNDTGLKKIVNIGGTNISMGIQKIIFLIRGILKNNSMIYIFDEPLTSLDQNTRKKIMKMISSIVGNKTLIVITHDMEINEIVNKIINLKDLMN